MNYRPHLLPKIRSRALMDAIGGKGRPAPMPCTVRISGMIPGHRCAPQNTVVAAHTGNLGKGMSTKVSDLNCVAACMHCHDLIDGRDARWWWLLEHEPEATLKRIIAAQHETLAMLVDVGVVSIKGASFS